MAHLEKLGTDILHGIAAQVAERLPFTPELAAPGAAPGLGESLKVKVLPLNNIGDADGPLADRVTDTGLWHHQIYAGKQAVNFARSMPRADAPGAAHSVVEVSTSKLPQDLRRTIEWVDANIPEDAVTDLLLVPAYLLSALWIHGDGIDAVVVSQIPNSLKGVPLNKRIDTDEFLRILRENDPIAGLGSPGQGAVAE